VAVEAKYGELPAPYFAYTHHWGAIPMERQGDQLLSKLRIIPERRIVIVRWVLGLKFPKFTKSFWAGKHHLTPSILVIVIDAAEDQVGEEHTLKCVIVRSFEID